MDEMTNAYSTGAEDAHLEVRRLPADDLPVPVYGARAAAICVLDSFLNHARGLDGCPTPLRRISREAAPPNPDIHSIA
jgi:hypothetical protein